MPIKLLFDTKNSITTGTVLTSNGTAVANSTSDGSEVMSGEMPLMTVSVKAVIGENNETYYSYVVAVGTSDFVDDEFIGGNIYGNRDIFYEVVRQFGNEIVPVDLNLRWLDENKLDITIGEARTWTLVLIGFMPIAATVVCVAVYRRRKHR